MNVKFTPRAESEAEAKTRRWRRNRQASPDVFDDELAEALAAIRKRLMPRTKNHVYFAVYEGVILIVSISGVPRRRGPKL